MNPENSRKYVGLFRDENTTSPGADGLREWSACDGEAACFGRFVTVRSRVGSSRVKFNMGKNGKPISAEADDGENTRRLIAEEGHGGRRTPERTQIVCRNMAQ